MIDINLFRVLYGAQFTRNLDAASGNRQPYVYNIETTNACPMRCKMCPRTTLMQRPVSTMPMSLFRKIVKQLAPHSPQDWAAWESWCAARFGIKPGDKPSENHFFLHVIPKVIQLHGYGEPLVDKILPERIGELTESGLQSYFSCNPSVLAEMNLLEHMRNGLDFVKFSIESTDDSRFQSIRGAKANFTESYKSIKSLLAERDRKCYATQVVITMLDLGEADRDWEFKKLKEAFKDLPVYMYLKSEDTQWLRKEGKHQNKSIHWSNRCLHPWVSMTILANGTVGACMETYDNDEFDLGDAKRTSLFDIWNGKKYRSFRESHLTGLGLPSKCSSRCDMPMVSR